MRTLLILIAVVLLAACKHSTQPDLPGAGTVVHPAIVTVERIVYVKVPSDLTQPEPVAEGPIAQCFDVAAQRRAALARANSKLKQIGHIQGTEVKP